LSGLYEDDSSLEHGVFEMVADVHRVAIEAADVEPLMERLLTITDNSAVEEGLTELGRPRYPTGNAPVPALPQPNSVARDLSARLVE
jgi:hypothetical protein